MMLLEQLFRSSTRLQSIQQRQLQILIRDDYEVVITHSNGPQVGMIHTAMSEFCRIYPEYTATPTAVCSAMSQGYIGYDLQNAIRTELLGRGIYKTVSTILTQVVVDPYDEAFYHPTKIIGRVMTEAEAEEEEKKGNHVTQVEGGYRRVVAAPKPVDIVEKDAIKALVDADQVVIACGGGGIPVLAQDNKLQGASAVIEKDLAAGKLADTLDADRLVILTSVDKVCLNYGKEDEKPLDTMTVEEAKKYLAAGEFDEGTMAPKELRQLSTLSVTLLSVQCLSQSSTKRARLFPVAWAL